MLWTMAMGFTLHRVLSLSANLDTAVAALTVKDDFQMTFGKLIFTFNT